MPNVTTDLSRLPAPCITLVLLTLFCKGIQYWSDRKQPPQLEKRGNNIIIVSIPLRLCGLANSPCAPRKYAVVTPLNRSAPAVSQLYIEQYR